MYDRDDKDQYESPEESEYHFSDEDVNYEVEEAQKVSRIESLKTGFFSRFQKSKRLYIGIVVFLILVYISYQMLFPSSPTPTTEFAATAPTTAPQPAPMTTMSAQPSKAPTQPTAPSSMAAASPVIPIGQQVTVTVPQPASPSTQPTVPTPQPTPIAQSAPTMPVNASSPGASPTQTAPPVSITTLTNTPPSAAVPPAPIVSNTTTSVTTTTPVPAPPIPVTGTPPTPSSVSAPVLATPMAITSAPPAAVSAPNAPSSVPIAAIPALPAPTMNAAPPAAVATVQTTGAPSPMNQFQTEYNQKLNEFSEQNKATQEQLMALSTRVAGMEEQLNQLLASLNKPAPAPTTIGPRAPVTGEPKTSYTVQAIIPGRAWLKSDNGETVTVAEGDVLRGYGRVTKIDPYNGVVEIDTGSKIMALSYGNGG